MANELKTLAPASGLTVYFLVNNATSQVWNQNTSAFENYATANLTATKYCIAATNQGTASLRYVATMPGSIPQGVYSVDAYIQAGASPAEGDVYVGSNPSFQWSGSASAIMATPTNITGGTIATVSGNVNGSVGSVTGAVGSVTGNVGGNVAGSVGSVTAAITLPSIPTNWITAAGIAASAMNGKGDWLVSSSYPLNFGSLGISVGGHISNVDTLTTYTGNTPQTGDAYARIGAAGVGLTNLGDTRIANLDAAVSSRASASVAPSWYVAPTTPPTTAAITAAVLAGMIDTTYTLAQYVEIIGAAVAAADSGGPGSPAFKSLDGTKTVITGTADSSGNRSGITYTP